MKVESLVVAKKKPWKVYQESSSSQPVEKIEKKSAVDDLVKEAFDRGYVAGKSEIGGGKLEQMIEEAKKEAVEVYKSSVATSSLPTPSKPMTASEMTLIDVLGDAKVSAILPDVAIVVFNMPTGVSLESEQVEKIRGLLSNHFGRSVGCLCVSGATNLTAVSEVDLELVGLKKIPGHRMWEEPESVVEPEISAEEKVRLLMEKRRKERQW